MNTRNDDAAETMPELTEADKFVLQWLKEQAPLMQDENGIDLGRIRENLKLTPLERLRRFDRNMASIRSLRARHTLNVVMSHPNKEMPTHE